MTLPEMIEAKVAEFEGQFDETFKDWKNPVFRPAVGQVKDCMKNILRTALTDTYNKGKHDGYAEEGIKCYEHSKAEYERGREEGMRQGYEKGLQENAVDLVSVREQGRTEERTRIREELEEVIKRQLRISITPPIFDAKSYREGWKDALYNLLPLLSTPTKEEKKLCCRWCSGEVQTRNCEACPCHSSNKEI